MADSNQHSELRDLVSYIEDAFALLDSVEPDFSSETPHVLSELRGFVEQYAALEHRCEMLQQELERVSRTLMRTAGATGV